LIAKRIVVVSFFAENNSNTTACECREENFAGALQVVLQRRVDSIRIDCAHSFTIVGNINL